MMKRLLTVGIFVFLGVIFTFSLKGKEIKKLEEADKYTVVNVQGKIIFKKTGSEMKRGDIYVYGTILDFLSSSSRAAIINKSKGRYVLTGSTKGKVKVLPATNNISSRSGSLLNVVDLKKHFADRYLVLDNAEIQIGSGSFPMTDTSFFYLTYEHLGETIAKRLSFNGDKLILDKNEIFSVDGKSIPVEEKEMTLYYRNSGKGTKISSFIPIFPDLVDLKAEVSVILEMFDSESVEKKINEVTAHLTEFYGQPQKENLNSWLEKEFKLKK